MLPTNTWKDTRTNNDIHLAFTGGESMRNQWAIIEIMNKLVESDDFPLFVTIETNGTQPLSNDFKKMVLNLRECFDIEFSFSISPKLFHVTGELYEKTIKPEVVKSYQDITTSELGETPTYLKIVVNSDERSWVDLKTAENAFRDAGVTVPIWIMPVGATVEEQGETAGELATKAISMGYNVSARVHAYLWANIVGV